jgi:hypothetical protein
LYNVESELKNNDDSVHVAKASLDEGYEHAGALVMSSWELEMRVRS